MIVTYIKLLVKLAKENGIEPVGTFIQKGMYLLDAAFDAKLNIHFEAYLYGPYSREIDGIIDYLKYRKELEYIDLEEIKPEVINHVKQVIDLFKKAEQKFIKYNDFKSRLWELLATADYVMRYVKFRCNPKTEDGLTEIANAINRWKKYFSVEEAKEAAVFVYDELNKTKEVS